MKFGQLMSYYKRKLKTTSKHFCVCKEISTTSIGKWHFWSKLLILDMWYLSYRNLFKSACGPPQIPFYREFFETFFHKKFFFCNITSTGRISLSGCVYFQSYSVNVFRVSYLDIWWRHGIWISENLKFDYLKNGKIFRSEIKNIFPCFARALL